MRASGLMMSLQKKLPIVPLSIFGEYLPNRKTSFGEVKAMTSESKFVRRLVTDCRSVAAMRCELWKGSSLRVKIVSGFFWSAGMVVVWVVGVAVGCLPQKRGLSQTEYFFLRQTIRNKCKEPLGEMVIQYM